MEENSSNFGNPKSYMLPGLVVMCLLGAVLAFDLMMPLGVAGGVPYIVPVMIGLWLPRRELVLYIALTGTVLTLCGYYFSPPGGVAWVVITNRMLAIFAIWVTAILIYKYSNIMAERRKLARAVEQSSVGVVITDAKGVIEYANRKIIETSGYELSEVLGKTPRVFKSGYAPPGTYAGMWKTITSGGEWRGDLVNKAKDGHLYWEEIHISPVFGRTGEIRNFVGIKEDITERKRVEDELVTARQQAQIANEAKSAFLADMSHELRTPLNAIIGFSESMTLQVMGPMENSTYKEYSHHIHNSALHLNDMINNILDLAKIESGKEELREQEVDISVLLLECVSLVKGLASKNGVVIVNKEACDICCMYADGQKIKQVLLNLLSNAIKFTQRGGQISLRVYSSEDRRGVIEVSDTGIGIAKQNQGKVFSKFEQVENSLARPSKGTGLGLPLSRNLMEMHEGSLELESDPGSGTTVRMNFPAERIIFGEPEETKVCG